MGRTNVTSIREIVNIYQMDVVGMTLSAAPLETFSSSASRGPVNATAESLVKNARAAIKIDCAEFQHSHEIAKLIGSPLGY